MVQQFAQGVKGLAAFVQVVQKVNPKAAEKGNQALKLISEMISELRGGGPAGAGAPPGGVPAPAPQAAEQGPPQTPEAT